MTTTAVVDTSVEFVDEPDTEAELEAVSSADVAQVVLNATDWTTETILRQISQGNIDLEPRFQRRDAWPLEKKSRYIESLILGLPVPQIVLAERKGGRNKYVVLDGKQRLLTLRQFTGSATGKFNNFKLTSLEIRRDLNGKRFSDLEQDLAYDDLSSFNNQTIRTVVVRNWTTTALLHVMFLRLNTSTVPLSPQELRQALFQGEFSDFVDDKAAESPALRQLLRIREPDFRMRDVELLVRYLAFSYFLPDYAGNMKQFLDDTCEKLNKSWSDMAQDIKDRADAFEGAVDVASQIFGQVNVGRRWLGNRFDSRFNRAVLDVTLYYFSDSAIRTAALEEEGKVLRAWTQLFDSDAEFREAITSTTKSLQATYIRLAHWGRALQAIMPVSVHIPNLENEGDRLRIRLPRG
jgi:hypothetical protein